MKNCKYINPEEMYHKQFVAQRINAAVAATGAATLVRVKCEIIIDITTNESTPAAGATVYVDRFNPLTNEVLPTQEITTDSNGKCSFSVMCGWWYALYSKLDGYSASCQWAFPATGGIVDAPTLQHFTCGVYLFADGHLMSDTTDYSDEQNGFVVATQDTTFLIGMQISPAYMLWSRQYALIPTLPEIQNTTEAYADFNGALNTAKILTFGCNAEAARYAQAYSQTEGQHFMQFYLPSEGQLRKAWEYRGGIDILRNNMEECRIQRFIGYWYWSSTQYDRTDAWYAYMNEDGFDDYYNNKYGRYDDGCVLPFAAFQLI